MNVNRGTEDRQALPSGWRWVKLGDVCCFRHGGTPLKSNPNYWSGTIPWVSPKDMKTDLIRDTEDHITQEALNRSSSTLVPEGTILIVVRSGILSHYFPVAIAERDVVFNQDIKAIIPDDVTINTNFLFQWLRSKEGEILSEGIKKGATVHSFKSAYIENLEIPLPPLAKQKRIAAILNEQTAAVEKARAAAEAQLEAAKALFAAYLRRVFPKPGQTLPPGWRLVRLGDHTTKIGSGITPLGGQASYLNAGTPLIRSQNIHNNYFVKEGLAFISKAQDEEMENSRVIENDVLLNITGASIGRVCVVPSTLCPSNVNQHVSIIRCTSEIHSPFLSYYISTNDFQKHILESQAGATRQALTKALIEEFRIPLPALSEQKRIAAILNEQMVSAERLRNDLEKQLHEINSLPAALLRRAFSGEL